MNRIWQLFPLTLLVVGCQQDPYADQAVSPSRPLLNQKPTQGLDPNKLKIESSNPFYNFSEAIEGEASFQARVLEEGVKFSVTVQNADEFEGYQFDQATGVFRWTPKLGYVKGGKSVDKQLQVLLKTDETPSFKSSQKLVNVPITVYKLLNPPEIIDVQGIPSTVVIGKRYPFSIRFFDTDAANSVGFHSQVKVNVADGSSWILPLIKPLSAYPVQAPQQSELFTMDFEIDLTNTPLGVNQEDITLGFSVLSPFDVSSTTSPTANFSVETVLSEDIQFSFLNQMKLATPIKKSTTFSFSAYDRKNDGNLSMTAFNFGPLPDGDISWSCPEDSSTGILNCKMTVTPKTAGKTRFVFIVTSKKGNQEVVKKQSIWLDSSPTEKAVQP